MTMVTMITHILSFKSKYGIALSIMIERAAYKIKNQSAGESNKKPAINPQKIDCV